MSIELTEEEAHAVGRVLTCQFARHVMGLDGEHYYRTVAKFTKFDKRAMLLGLGSYEVGVASRCGAVAETDEHAL